MRKIIDMQMKIGETAVAGIKFDPRSRDEIPKLLRGLQAIYCNRDIRTQVCEALIELIPPHIDIRNSRKGMDLWKIFVLGVLRLTCNCDSFVVETNMHYPTDINLLFAAVRKMITLMTPKRPKESS